MFNKLLCTLEYKAKTSLAKILSEYQFYIEHIKGKISHLGHFLSREANEPNRRSLGPKGQKTLLEMAIHELRIAQERVTEIHSSIYEEIH